MGGGRRIDTTPIYAEQGRRLPVVSVSVRRQEQSRADIPYVLAHSGLRIQCTTTAGKKMSIRHTASDVSARLRATGECMMDSE
jgi:hypothetical protein